jgi:2-methylcitrate dehydratase PrpD
MTERTLAQQLASFALAQEFDALPDDVASAVRDRVLDTLGLCLASTDVPAAVAVLDYAEHVGGRAEATVIGHPRQLPSANAALVNGVLAHGLDFDDTHLPSILHPSASVVPAALAVGEAVSASGRDLLAAVAVGLEACVRLGMAGYDRSANNSVYFEHGQHATSICGAIGSAITAAKLLGADEEEVLAAIGIAASMASGIIEANRTGGTVKQVHCGWAAHAGVTAAELAIRGVTGPPTVLEGRFGFFEAFLRDRVDLSAVSDGLGTTWELLDINVKPYPANYFTHTGIDAAIAVRGRGVRPEDIVSIRLGVAAPTVRTIGEPIEGKRRPQTGYQGRFSGPYTLAAALLGGSGLGLGLDDFTDELVGNPAHQSLMDRVEVFADPRCDDGYPRDLPASLEVTLTDGTVLHEWVPFNRGGPRRPLGPDDLSAKFRETAGRALSGEQVDDLLEMLNKLDAVADVREVGERLANSS